MRRMLLMVCNSPRMREIVRNSTYVIVLWLHRWNFFDKVHVINLTQAGLKAMEELAKLEAERGNPEYLEEGNFRQRFQEKSWEGRDVGARHPEERAGRSGKADPSGNRRASNEMCIFLILNISSLQLIPVNMIAYRSQYGSANPTAIIAPAIAATLVSTLVAIVYCKVKDRGGRIL